MGKNINLYNELLQKNLEKKDNNVITNYKKLKYLYENNQFKEIIYQNIFPYKMDIEPTSRCFLNCNYCQVPYWERNRLTDLTLERFKVILNKLPYLLEVKLQGQGEPLLNKEFFKMVEYATQKNVIVRTYTNGMLLNFDKCKAIIDSGLFEIRFSIDAATQETTDIMRKGMDLEFVKRNIITLLELRGNKSFPRINIWSILCNKNINEMEKIVKMCIELGVDGIYFQSKLSAHGNEQTEQRVKEDTLDIKANNVLETFTMAKELVNGKAIDFEIQTSKWRSIKNPCWWINNSALITLDGYVLPCCMICYPERLNFGNIFSNTFEEIWSSKKYKNFRIEMLNGNIIDSCKWCYGIN